jgi:hypothetical protein
MTTARWALVPLLMAGAVAAAAGSGQAFAASPPAVNPPAHGGVVSFPLLDLTAPVPASWVSQPPASSMRLAQFRVPGAAGFGDPEFVVFYFGPGQGGSVDANITRWEPQFTAPDGKPVKAIVRHLTVSRMPVTTVELTGTYARGVGMGPAGAPTPDQTLLVAIVETPRGNLTLQLHGPHPTVTANREALWTLVQGTK